MKKIQMRTARVLLGAAEILNERGWTRGIMEDRWGRCCMLGALEKSMVKQKKTGSVIACTTIRRIIDDDNISGWNDRKCKSRDHAIEILTSAASLALYEEE